MNTGDFVTESEAAAYAGVSVATLNRFAEAGYLQIEQNAGEGRLYSQSELASVFGLSCFSAMPRRTAQGSGNGVRAAPKPEKNSRPSAAAAQSSSALHEQIEKSIVAGSDGEAAAGPDTSNEEVPTLSNLIQDSPPDRPEESGEVACLQRTLELQQKLLELKEAEVKDLQDQRQWLRTRLERLEEKAERDQLLLLSETQTIRKLINLEEQRKSPLRLALEWLGFTAAPGSKSDTIEVRSENPQAGQNEAENNSAAKAPDANPQ